MINIKFNIRIVIHIGQEVLNDFQNKIFNLGGKQFSLKDVKIWIVQIKYLT